MACVVGLFALTTLPRPTNVAALIPRVLFPAIMLAAFIAMTGRFAQALIGIGAARLVLTLAFIRTKNIGVSTCVRPAQCKIFYRTRYGILHADEPRA